MISQNVKIIFFGTPIFAVSVLNKLIEKKHNILGVFTGHGPVELEAEKLGIKIFKPKSLKKDEEIFEQFKTLNPDLCIVAAYGKIIPKKYLDIPKHGFVNVHPSLLPKYRGPSPIQTAILNGDIETGVSIMMVDEEMDHGPLLAQKTYNLQHSTFNIQASKELFTLGAELLVKILPNYLNSNIKHRPQDHNKATFTKMFKREDGKINWNQPAEQIYNQIRALNPEPGTWTTWNPPTSSGQKSKVINILTSQVGYPQVGEKTGTIKKINNDIAVITQTCYLILKQVQLEGGKEMDIKSFMNGHHDFLDSTLE